MKKIIFIIIITVLFSYKNSIAAKIDCTQFDKLSAKYLECTAVNLKEKSKELKLKATIEAKDLKDKATANAKNSKDKFNKSTFKEKLINFKNSKTLTEFMEK
jgi:hypothetical protein